LLALERLELALADQRVDRLHLDAEQAFDSLLDVGFVAVLRHVEDDLV
jgi:hypothetical protein